jgi:hypothetical protein
MSQLSSVHFNNFSPKFICFKKTYFSWQFFLEVRNLKHYLEERDLVGDKGKEKRVIYQPKGSNFDIGPPTTEIGGKPTVCFINLGKLDLTMVDQF